jgi:hypothetical protein
LLLSGQNFCLLLQHHNNMLSSIIHALFRLNGFSFFLLWWNWFRPWQEWRACGLWFLEFRRLERGRNVSSLQPRCIEEISCLYVCMS